MAHWTPVVFIGPAHACCSFLSKLRLDVNQSGCEKEQEVGPELETGRGRR